jgi:pseudouridine synthase
MLVTLKDQRGRLTVASILEEIPERVFPIGRLDRDSEGLLLLTNDGDLAYRVAHPTFKLPKTYHVTVSGTLSTNHVEKLGEGVFLRDGWARPISARMISSDHDRSTVEIVLGEGRKREVRRMIARLGFQVDSLVRVGLGSLTLGSLRPGEWRLLNPDEVKGLRVAVGLEE